MRRIRSYLKCILAAFFASLLILSPVHGENSELETLLEGLKTADSEAASQIEGRIYAIWSQTGSDAMDLLLSRGREALEAGDAKAAVDHFSALIDHSPDFAEGYNSRATAYFQNQQFGLSLEDIRQTLILNPRHFGAMSGLAIIFEEIGRPEAALETWREVEKIYPSLDGLSDAISRLEKDVDGQEI